MKTRISVSLVGAILLISSLALSQQSNKAESLYQEALMQMEGKGNFSKALEVFGQIIKDYPGNRQVSARSQYQIGVCYEKLGKNEAKKAYEQVVKNFADQPQVVAEARTRLAALSAATESGRGPVARRVLSAEDTEMNDFVEMSPSLDGRRVAYVNMWEGGRYVRDLASGDVQRLVAGLPAVWHYFPKWSADGRRLAVATTDLATKVTSIELIDIATHAAVAVPGTRTQGQGSINPAEWSRDGRFLLCVRKKRLVLITLDGGTMTTLADRVR
ncbi:MAG: hypothetical protein HW389_2762, partial [Bacteroidetes bacterium]|nr:hypothetical protein [Bacteroidota bacterium]